MDNRYNNNHSDPGRRLWESRARNSPARAGGDRDAAISNAHAGSADGDISPVVDPGADRSPARAGGAGDADR
jgi:hypothetical protein